jgi:folate-dependent phosphoribosylglycinamide formyltransferase PurN
MKRPVQKSKWALFISGRGSTAQSFLDLADLVDVRLVISNRAKALGLLRAKKMGIPTLTIDKNTSWQQIHSFLKLRRIDKIFLLGFMKLVPGEFVELWKGRIFNVHPSLLPKYPGLHAIENSFKDQAEMGVTVHHVIAEMDSGPAVFQKKIPGKEHLKNIEDAEI